MISSGKHFHGPHFAIAVVALCGLALSGCGTPEAQFEQNMVYLRSQEFANLGGEKLTAAQLQNVADVTAALFGTPDNPVIPQLADVDTAVVLDENLVRMSAGKVTRDELAQARGLYRQHCVHCHGVSGDGQGPTAAFLNPYPRDFRKGMYKFKSTAFGTRPRHEDLQRIIMEGIPGTAMPSFKLLDSDEVESLVHYVKYLGMRGEVERDLMRLATLAEPEDPESTAPALLLDPTNPSEFQVDDISAAVADAFGRWAAAGEIDPEAPEPPAWQVPQRPEWTTEERLAARVRGKALFYGVGNCYSCHGETGLGDGTVDAYDEWGKELEPTDHERLQEYLALGALQPRHILPRNFRQGIFRGGRRPIDIYWRIRHGIEGSGMPSVPFKGVNEETGEEFGTGNGLTSEDVWSLVEYVTSLQYDQYSQDFDGIALQRDRQ